MGVTILANKLHPSVVESYYKKNPHHFSDEESDNEEEEILDLMHPKAPVIIDDDFTNGEIFYQRQPMQS